MDKVDVIKQSYIKEFNFNYSDCSISLNQIISLLGYNIETVPSPILESLESIIQTIPSILKLQSGFKIFDSRKIKFASKGFTIEDQTFDCGKIIQSNLKNSDTIVFIISTLGNELEALSKIYMDSNDILKGYLIDKIGSELVETLTDKTESYLQKFIDPYELKMTNRYSPGYCGWNVSDQQKLFSLLPDKFCNVSLNEDSLMIPIKSISAVIGIGGNVERKNYQCSICDIEFCYKRDHNG